MAVTAKYDPRDDTLTITSADGRRSLPIRDFLHRYGMHWKEMTTEVATFFNEPDRRKARAVLDEVFETV